ncbi:preprotein translocase subunit SecY [Kluyvera cryocrescens]|uniref:Preprotein translocase subunit SecY n=1 Tax=Kluyvera cryocrescens TaxID=580 RepID=A0A485AEX2_KLUCR|nr:preprotein translocase subunit SecY [Kluyvera cryocrescens]
MQGLVINPGFAFYFTAVVSLVTGTMFLMWLGEQITERGIGNGISIIIFAGIVAGLPPAIAHTIEQARQGDLHFLLLLLVAVLVFAVTFFVVFVERGQRRIVVNYAKRQQGRRVYAAQSTHLPLKVNMAGVIPAIFASSIILFPATIASWFGGGNRLELADNNFAVFAAWATALCVTLCVCNHLLLFLLHGVGLQPA